jgi:hypothetical protein
LSSVEDFPSVLKRRREQRSALRAFAVFKWLLGLLGVIGLATLLAIWLGYQEIKALARSQDAARDELAVVKQTQLKILEALQAPQRLGIERIQLDDVFESGKANVCESGSCDFSKESAQLAAMNDASLLIIQAGYDIQPLGPTSARVFESNVDLAYKRGLFVLGKLEACSGASPILKCVVITAASSADTRKSEDRKVTLWVVRQEAGNEQL